VSKLRKHIVNDMRVFVDHHTIFTKIAQQFWGWYEWS